MRYTYRHTLLASYLGYITQAIVVNLAPLLYVTFQTTFTLSMGKIGLIASINFAIQIVTDFISARVIDRTGFRVPVVLAHIMASIGLVLLGLLPGVIEPYAGILIATFFMAVGGGLTEVLISPIVEALPGDAKASAMSLLHSFYSWGQVAVVLGSTAYFALFGRDHWRVLPLIWALIPAFNIFLFAKVPLKKLVESHERTKLRALFSRGLFWVLLILMVCSGAAEQAMSQWASLFAEVGLNVSKAMGDLLGPCLFALFMGLARTYNGIRGEKLNIKRALTMSAALGVVSYLIVVFSPWPIISLMGCALTGLSVAILWPGVLSLSSSACPMGGAAMFAILALAGDLGCSIGPGLVGLISSATERGAFAAALHWFTGDATQAGLRLGLLTAIIFPVLILAGVWVLGRMTPGQARRTP